MVLKKNTCCLICVGPSITLETFSRCIMSLSAQTVQLEKYYFFFDGYLEIDRFEIILNSLLNDKSIIHTFYCEKNIGFTNAINKLLSVSTEEIIFRMDIDDVAREDRFEIQLEYFNKYPDIDVIGSNILEKGKNNSSIKVMPEFNNEIIKYSLIRNPINHMTVAFRRNSINKIGFYPNLRKKQDYAAWLLLIKNGYQFYNIQQTLVTVFIDNEFYIRRRGLQYAFIEYMIMLYKIKTFKKRYIALIIIISSIRFLSMIFPLFIVKGLYKVILRRNILGNV